MHITILGCGAMGSIYAGLLASSGHNVTGIDTNTDHINAINKLGLRVSGASGDRTVNINALTTVPESPTELVVIAVKGAHVEAAAKSARQLVSNKTLILTIQNGLGSADIVAEILGADQLIVGIAQGFGASLPEPGHTHHNDMKAIRMGAYGSLGHDQVKLVSDTFQQAGFDAESVTNISAMQWEKLICNVAYSALSALTGMTVGEIRDDPVVSEVSQQAATEAWEIARAAGIALDVEDPVEHVRAFAERMPAAKPSVLLDIQAGRRSEVDMINGAVPREAIKLGMKAPVNDTLTKLVLSLEDRTAQNRTQSEATTTQSASKNF